jgi:endoglucanase
MGNLLCIREYGPDAPTILLDAHMDEVGFIVKYIDDDGYLYLDAVGGIDTKALIGTCLLVHGKERVRGVVSGIPPHIAQESTVPDLDDIPLDIGMSSREAKEMVPIGSPVTFSTKFRRVGQHKVCSKALDNRAGCAILCSLSRTLDVPCNLAFLFSSQEEVGTRGAYAALTSYAPDLAISIDTTHGDMYGVPKEKTRSLASGTILGVGANIHRALFDRLRQTAKDEGIAHTTKAYAGATPTNLRSIQVAGRGVPTALLSVPTRYLHTPAEVADLRDIKATQRLLSSFIASIDASLVEAISC